MERLERTYPITLVGRHTRPYLENAHARGRKVSAVDGFNDWDAARFARLTGADEWHGGDAGEFLSRWTRAEGGIIFCSPVENHPEVIRQARAAGRTVFNAGADAIAICREPAFLRSLEGDGIFFPKTSEMSGGARHGWIIKNRFSAGGTGIRPDDGVLREGEYRQELLTGDSIGAAYYTFGGQTVFAGATAHINRGFLYGGGIFPADIIGAHRAALERFGERAAMAAGLAGWWGADFIVNGAGLWLLEINPRFTAGMELIARARGADLLETQIAATDDFCQSSPSPDKVASDARKTVAGDGGGEEGYLGNMVVYAEKDFVFDAPQKWFERGARDVPPHGRRIRAGAPALTLYAHGATSAGCRSALADMAAAFHEEHC